MKSSNAQIVVVDDNSQLKKICEAKQDLQRVKALIQMTNYCDGEMNGKAGMWKWNELEMMKTDDVEGEFDERQLKVTPNQCCAVLYTSGTIGNPKGAMISHDNFTWTLKTLSKRLDISTANQEVFMSYLPVSHMAGQMIDVFLSLYVAATVYFAEKNAIKSSFLETLTETRPTLFMGKLS